MDNNRRLYQKFSTIQFLIITLIGLMVGVLTAPIVSADTLVTSERRITSSMAYETTPALGNNGITDILVYTVRPVLAGGALGAGNVWYQPLVDGAPSDLPGQVTDSPTDDQLNDISGDYIVYTAYDTTTSSSGAIMVYQISTGVTHTLGTATIIQEPKIHGDRVVWREGGALSAMVMYFELGWITTGSSPFCLAGPVPPTFDIQIGSRYAVWAELIDGHYDIFAYDFDMLSNIRVTDTSTIDERQPATSGPWIVWQQQDGATSTIEGYNPDFWDRVTIINNGAGNFNPSMDGDLVAWETDVAGNLDIWVYRMSEGQSYAVTNDPEDQYLNDVFGNLMAYVDMRGGSEDVYVSTLTFNEAPVADAGEDQALQLLNVPVTLDGSQSWDPEGDPITFNWGLVPPEGSLAQLDESGAVMPTFSADVYGIYIATLVVTDSVGNQSASDTVTATFSNVIPVADAGIDQSVAVGDTVILNGSATDANNDPLTFAWTFTSVPDGNTAVLVDADRPDAKFTPNVAGIYELQLIVNDGIVDSIPDTVIVQVVEQTTTAIEAIQAVQAINDSLDSGVFKNKNNQKIFNNKLNVAIAKITDGDYASALTILQKQILSKTNGCAENGEPDKNDWVRDCESQTLLYPAILLAIAQIEALLP